MENTNIEYKKVNWSFFAFLGFELALMIFLVFWGRKYINLDDIMISTVLAESTILIPPLIILLCNRYEEGFLNRVGFKSMKLSTWGLVLLYGIAIMPLGTLANAISMLFVDNTVLEVSGTMLEAPWYMTFISTAIMAPLIEEFAFRGFMFRGYRRDKSRLSAVIISALSFAFMHLNFNQAAYAFVLGVAFALVVEATDSIWSSIFCHFLFNAETVVVMVISEYISPGLYDDISVDRNELLYSIPGYITGAGVALVFAVAILFAIAKNQGRTEQIKELFQKPEKKSKIISVPLVLAYVFCLMYMVLML